MSILSLDGGDKRFYNAHLDAVKETLKIIERDCAQSKVFKNGKTRFENTKNLAISLVRHTASRERDPHLHHHALVMNVTKRSDNAWRSLASSMVKQNGEVNGFFERIHKNQIYYGLIYKASLANRVKNLGCEIEMVGKHGMWEIKGVPKEARDLMSKRRQQIEGRIEKLNYRSLKAADVAALDTREKKSEDIKLDEIKQVWKNELASVGFSSKDFIAGIDKGIDERSLGGKDGMQKNNPNISGNAKEAVKDAIEHLSQYSLKLDYAKIVSQALEFSIGKSIHGDMVEALNRTVKEGNLIPLDKSDSMFVTKKLIETEKTIMDLVGRSKDTNVAINLKSKIVDSIVAGEVKDSAINILQSNNRLSLIESRMTDNTEFVSDVLKLAESSGKIVRILSPNRMMTNDINENIKRKPSNLWQWLVSLGKPELGESIAGFKHKYKEEIDLPLLRFRQGKDVIVVNSSETLGCNDMHSLLELTEKTNAKVIFLRELNARHGFSAGNSIETLKQAGIETFKISTAEKAINYVPELKAVKDNNERTKQLARSYALKEDKDRDKTIVFIGAKGQIKSTNDAIRKELKNQEKLSGIEHAISVLNPVYMSKPEITLAHRYQKNMIIRFYDANRMHKDWKIEDVNKEQNTLRLIRNGKRILWDPKKQETNHIAFKRELLQITKGDKLIATGGMKDLGIKNATRFIVQEVSKKHIKLSSGAEATKITKIGLDDLKNSHFKYDYATTISKYSKKQEGHVLADIKAYSLDKSTINELTGRAKESLTIFTNDADIAQKRFGHMPIKLTAAKTLLDVSEGRQVTGSSKVDRFINNKTIMEIKGDIEKAIVVLESQHDLVKSAEKKAVDFAIEKITSHNAGFTHKELVVEALSYALREQMAVYGDGVTHEDIMKVIAEKRSSGELVIGKHFDDGTRWTTKEILELERSIIKDIKKGRNKLEPLLDQKTARSLLEIKNEKINLTQDQKNACHLIATTKDQFVIIQGYAGTGKTTMFSHVHSMLKEVNKAQDREITERSQIDIEVNQKASGIKGVKETEKAVEILALAATHKAVKELKNIGVEAQTLKSLLIEQQREGLNSSVVNTIQGDRELNNDPDNKGLNSKSFLDNKLIILDEDSMVTNKDFAQFLGIVGNSKGRVVLSGDMAQNTAIGSGKPVEITQRSNILETSYLRELVRQKNPNLKEAVESVINGDYDNAFKKIENENPQKHIERIGKSFFDTLKTSIVEIDNNKLKKGEKTLEEMTAEDFLTRTPETRDKTVVIVHANKDRKVITNFIREGLKKQGDIAHDGIEVNCLVPKGLTDAECKSLQSYNIGDVVKFGKGYYHVVENDQLSKSLMLRDEAGKIKYFYPEKYVDRYNVELYENIKAELATGDIIRLTKTDKERELYASFEYKVKNISEKEVILEGKDSAIKGAKGKEIRLHPKELKDAHWDYAQTVTGYGFQGGSEKFTIDFEVSYRKNLANQRSFYVGVSRASEHLVIYTDNKERLRNRILANKGDKYAALEVSGELKASNNNVNQRDISDGVRAIKETKAIVPTKNKLRSDYYDAKEIGRLLSATAESFVEKMLGRPNEKLSSSSEWRYGKKGSLVINMSGDKRGLWKNFETGESGNLLTLLQNETGLSFRESLKYAVDMFSGGSYVNISKHEKASTNSNTSIDKNRNKGGKTSEYAQKLAFESIPIAGTVAERYLKENRGIHNVDSQDIRYHPKVYVGKNEKAEGQKYAPAMISIGRDKDGNVQCVQATYLDSKTANKANLDVKKRTYSSPSGASVSLQKHEENKNILSQSSKNNKISFIAEGVETGLSVKDAIKNSDVMVTLGKSNLTNIDPQKVGQKVVFCLDNDGEKSFTDNAIHQAAQRLIDFGKEVFIAIPDQINGAKTDFNDVGKMAGVGAVKDSLNDSITYHDWKKTTENNVNKVDKIDTKGIEKIVQKEITDNNKPYYSSIKLPDIDLDKAVKFINLEQKSSFSKDLNAYKSSQEISSIQNNIDGKKGMDIPDIQKTLAKTEKEIY